MASHSAPSVITPVVDANASTSLKRPMAPCWRCQQSRRAAETVTWKPFESAACRADARTPDIRTTFALHRRPLAICSAVMLDWGASIEAADRGSAASATLKLTGWVNGYGRRSASPAPTHVQSSLHSGHAPLTGGLQAGHFASTSHPNMQAVMHCVGREVRRFHCLSRLHGLEAL